MKVLVYGSDYGDNYYDASTPEAMSASVLEILKSVMNYEFVDPSGEHMDQAKERYEAALGAWQPIKDTYNADSVSQSAIKKEYDAANVQWGYYVEQLGDYNRAKAALENRDAKAAWALVGKLTNDYGDYAIRTETVWTEK